MAVALALFAIPGPAQAASYQLPENGDDLIGAVTGLTLAYEDTLAAIAEKYGIGYRELVDANPDVDPWLPGEGTQIQLPTAYVLPSAPREGLVINLAEYRLYYYPPGGARVVTFPVGVGRVDFPTPLIRTKVITRIENPSWTPTEAARREHAEIGDPLPRVVPPGPENPLGHLAIQLGVPGYFIHGTNKPFGVGQMVSHGCVRLYPGDIETLVELVPNGTAVYIVDEPVKVGWRNGALYAEAHKSLYGQDSRTDLVRKIVLATEKAAEKVAEEPGEDATQAASSELAAEAATEKPVASVNWQRVEEIGTSLTGVPVRL